MPYDVTLLAVYTLALASVTRLVTGMDTLTSTPHGWVVGRIEALADWSVTYFDTARWSAGWWTVHAIRAACWFIGKMIDCYWCAPFWIAAVLLWAEPYWGNPVMLFIALALAMRFAAGTLITIGR
jgi:hypothetical protein